MICGLRFTPGVAGRSARLEPKASKSFRPARSPICASSTRCTARFARASIDCWPQPYAFFEAIWDEFLAPGDGFLLLARHGGATIAGVMYLRYADTIYYKFNASAREQLHVRPNDLLAWEGMSRAKQQLGCTKFDFGLSDSDQEGLLRYKRKFATEEKTIQFLRHVPDSWEQSPSHQEWSKILPQLTEILTDKSVPPAAAERASSVLYRMFT